MDTILSLLTGVVIAVMILWNGQLTAGYGNYAAAVIIHVVGTTLSGVLCLAGRRKVFAKAPFWAYLGGAIGVLSTLFNNYAFGHITMTSIVALGLLGQTITSVLLDRFGWLGAPKRRVDRSVAVALISAPVGIFLMLDGSVSQSILAVLLSLGAGVTVVLSRMVNARLASETSPLAGSFVNHLVGLPICVVLLLLLGQWTTPAAGTIEPWMYCGGMLGVTTVLLFNITVPKVSAFRLTLLSFVGQVFTGVALDVALGQTASAASFRGGLVIAAGLLVSQLLGARKSNVKA